MEYETTQRVTVSLPHRLARYLDEYQKTHQIGSRSEAVVRAIQALREKQLAEEYAQMARDHDPLYDAVLDDLTDGLEKSDGSEWR